MTEKETADLNRERRKQRVVNAYHRVFESADGKVVLDDIKRAFATQAQAFLPGHDFNPIVAAIRDGQRSVAIHIDSILERPAIADSNIETPKVRVRKK